MSVELWIGLPRGVLPTVEQINEALAADGFDLKLDPTDLRTMSGFWPASA